MADQRKRLARKKERAERNIQEMQQQLLDEDDKAARRALANRIADAREDLEEIEEDLADLGPESDGDEDGDEDGKDGKDEGKDGKRQREQTPESGHFMRRRIF